MLSKSPPWNLKKADIIALVGDPQTYGFGHLRRMQILKNFLLAKKISFEILITNDYWADVPFCSVLLLDRRDSPFPPIAKKRARKLIALDNQGKGALEAHFSLNLLPHAKMTHEEFCKSLTLVILPEMILQRKNASDKAKIHFSLKSHPPLANLRLFAKKRRSPEFFFRQNLIKAKTFSCYFGQSFFEALYLGKEIYLYSLTPTHRELAKHFLRNWYALKKPQLFFDGRGLFRLGELLTQLVHGG